MWPLKFLQITYTISQFVREFVSENPVKIDFFSATYLKPWISIVQK